MRRLALLVALACCTGCVRTLSLGSQITPADPIPDKSSERAAVMCSERLLDHVERASSGVFAASYELELGEPLCSVLLRTVEATHRAAQRALVAPLPGEYGRMVQLDLQTSSLHILPQGRGKRVVYTLSVVVARYGRELQPLGRNVVTGHSLVDCPEVTDEIVRDTVEAALQEVVDQASSLLFAWHDGPRVPASAGR